MARVFFRLATAAALAVVLAVSGCAGGAAPKIRESVRRMHPRIQQDATLEYAYKTFHHAGFRVAVRAPSGWSIGPDYFQGLDVRDVLPRAGTPARAALRPGDVVTLIAMEGLAGEQTASISPQTVGHAPNFVGKPVATAIAWADAARYVYWEIRKLPNLPPSGEPGLYAAYRVVAQSPAPGTMLAGKGAYWLKLKVAPR